MFKRFTTAAAVALLLALSAHAQTFCRKTDGPARDPSLFPTGGRESPGLRPFTVKQVTRRAAVTERPAPEYTDEAAAHGTHGVVILRVVLCPDGRVQTAEIIRRLPDGLTEKAIEAARGIKFRPAEKDGRKVAQFASITYDFNP